MRALLACLSVLSLSAPLAACSAIGGGDDAAKAAVEQLATGLGSHTLDGAALTDPADAKAFDEQVAAMSAYDVTVTPGDVDTDGAGGSARLQWSWDVDGHAWTYETPVALVKSGDTWQVDWAPASLAPDLTDAERLEVARTAAKRGDILGAKGATLVTARPVRRYGLDKARVKPAEVGGSATRIATAVGIDPMAFAEAARKAGPKAFVEAIVLRTDEAGQVADSFGSVPGAITVDDTLPLAPTKDFAAEILGRVGQATAEIVEKSNGRIRGGDEVGTSGLQLRYDEQLAGTPTVEVRADAAGEGACPTWPDCKPRVLQSWAGTPGQSLETTLDKALQSKAEAILAAAGGETSPASALVAIRPSTGEILAAANGPGNGGLNAATFGQYAPGSTFKVVTALALLRAGVQAGDAVECARTVNVNGRNFKNYDDYPANRIGRITLRQAVANSCNTALIGQHDRLGPDDLAQAAEALGLGVDHDLGFPAYFGQVPPPAGETEKAADLIGQGKVLASPMAMATVAASVAAGRVVVPHLLPATAPTASPRKPLTADEARTLRGLMRAVVTEGSGRFLADVPGAVGAKTGTAEYGKPAADGSLPTHTWMIATRGDLAVAVFVETGVSGSQTAGPLLEAFLR